MLLARRGELFQVQKIIKDFKLELNARDKDGNYFTHYLFSIPILKEKPINLNEDRVVYRSFAFMRIIENLLNDNPTHLNISPVRLDNISKKWSASKSTVRKRCK